MRQTLTRGLILGLAAAALAACGAPASGGGPAPLTPTSRFTLQTEPGLDRIALAVRGDGVSHAQHQALVQLAQRFHAEGAPEIVVEAPSGGDPEANAMAWAVRETLEAAGVPGTRVRVVGYHAPDPRAPVLAGFATVRAVVQDCSRNWSNLTATRDNQSAMNFGCAVNANMAAMIENPRDIDRPRAFAPGDAERRTVVLDAYRQGEATGTQGAQASASQPVP